MSLPTVFLAEWQLFNSELKLSSEMGASAYNLSMGGVRGMRQDCCDFLANLGQSETGF